MCRLVNIGLERRGNAMPGNVQSGVATFGDVRINKKNNVYLYGKVV